MQVMRMYLVNKRLDMNMSMRKTSIAADMDFHHYSRIERGEIARLDFLVIGRIAYALDVSLDDLYEMEVIYQQERSGDIDDITL